jgi:hypothetical protein
MQSCEFDHNVRFDAKKKIILLYHDTYFVSISVFYSKNYIKIHENDIINKHINATCEM